MIKVYTASKIDHAAMWINLRGQWPEVTFVARWPDTIGILPEAAWAAKEFWQYDLADVTKADVVLCYAAKGDTLRGALVEVGAALALDKKVIVVGKSESYGTWQHHPNVHQVPTLDDARVLLEMMNSRHEAKIKVRLPASFLNIRD